MAVLSERIRAQFGGRSPIVLDMFSGRGIIPLEAARAGASAVGTDLSPVATLAGRLLGDYPMRDWSTEPPLPYAPPEGTGDDDEDEDAGAKARSGKRKLVSADPTFEGLDGLSVEPRLLSDVRTVLAEVGRRVAAEVAHLYPGNPARGGQVPWAYLWAVTL